MCNYSRSILFIFTGTSEFLKAAGFKKTFISVSENEEEYWVFSPNDDDYVSNLEMLKEGLQTAEPIKPQLDRGLQVLKLKSLTNINLPAEFYNLTKEELKQFGNLAEDLGMDVLYEIHTKEELDKIDADNKIIGINNRNLKTFKVDLEHSIQLAAQIPDSCIKVSESGISDPKIITGLKEYGFQGFLIGENFMKTDNPKKAAKEFIQAIRG